MIGESSLGSPSAYIDCAIPLPPKVHQIGVVTAISSGGTRGQIPFFPRPALHRWHSQSHDGCGSEAQPRLLRQVNGSGAHSICSLHQVLYTRFEERQSAHP